MFEIFVTLTALVSAAIASVAGFGIGSLMTPLLSLELDLKTAVALVSLPHFVATAERFWRLRKELDSRVLVKFGIPSALGGLTGAILSVWFQSSWLTLVFAGLLIFAGLTGVTGVLERVRLTDRVSWIAGMLSGVFGGMVGNQGGIRAAALLTFGLSPKAFVATSTAIGLVVDLVRLPVYLGTQGRQVFAQWPLIVVSLVGVTAGTLIGVKLVAKIPKARFQRLVSGLIGLLGVAMFVKALKAGLY